MNSVLPLWFGIGACAGIGHAVALWRNTRHTRQPGCGGVARLALVAMVLVTAAIAQRLLPVAAGWGCGLAVTALLLYGRKSAWVP